MGLIAGLLFLWLFIAFPLWGIFDAATRPDDVWQEANQNKVVWVLLEIFLWSLGALVYFASIRPKLRTIQAERAWLASDDAGLAPSDVSYTLAEWNPAQLGRLATWLEAEGIDHRWEGVRLVVREGDDQRVDKMLDEIEGS